MVTSSSGSGGGRADEAGFPVVRDALVPMVIEQTVSTVLQLQTIGWTTTTDI